MKQLLLLLLIVYFFNSCIIQNPQPEDCDVITITVERISEGSSYDIVFHDANDNSFYYINRGLEQGYNLDSLNAKVLNKTVTLHLAKVLGGQTTNHIAQLAIKNDTIFTEFN